MSSTEVISPTQGKIGWFHEVKCAANDSVLIFQLPRTTSQISKGYLENARETLGHLLPIGRSAIIIGCDINIYELAGEDVVALKLKGLI
jgi:hypothetical protein